MKLRTLACRSVAYALAAAGGQVALAQYQAGQYAAAPQYAPQAAYPQASYPQAAYPQASYPQAAYPQIQIAQRVAYNNSPAVMPASATAAAPSYPYPMPDSGGYAQPAAAPAPAGDCNCGGAPTQDWSSYTAAPAGDCGAYPTSSCADYGASCYAAKPKRQWFVGAYGLLMQRSNPGDTKVAVLVPTVPSAYPYYPNSANVTYLTAGAADPDIQGGAEIRLGSTFGRAACGCSSQPYAWEVAYWGLAEESAQSVMTDDFAVPTRMYGSINYAGLEYDRDGAGGAYGYRPANDYFDYQMPITDPAAPGANDVRILGRRVRQTFNTQNVELNFWRFGTPSSTGCGAGAGGYAGGCGGGCADMSGCGSGCAPMGCQPCAPKRRFVVNGLAGVRYFKLDETFQDAVQYTVVDSGGAVVPGNPAAYTSFPPDDDNVLFYDVEVDNNLVGLQLGCSMNWLLGCKWTLFADSNFGVYGNHIDTYQRVFSGGGGAVRFVGTGGNAAVDADEDTVAFLGELRTGVAYQINCKWRATAAYRIIGVSGIATPQGQIPTNFQNAEHVSYIDTDNSLFLHGLQAGLELKF